MTKIHYKDTGVDHRDQGQTEYEYTHQTICGYVRDNLTKDWNKVTCKLCLQNKEQTNA